MIYWDTFGDLKMHFENSDIRMTSLNKFRDLKMHFKSLETDNTSRKVQGPSIYFTLFFTLDTLLLPSADDVWCVLNCSCFRFEFWNMVRHTSVASFSLACWLLRQQRPWPYAFAEVRRRCVRGINWRPLVPLQLFLFQNLIPILQNKISFWKIIIKF